MALINHIVSRIGFRRWALPLVATALSTGTANATTYLCDIQPKYGEVTIAPELAVQVFEDRASARVIDGVVNTVRDNGAFGSVEKRPALLQVTWEMRLPRRVHRGTTDRFTYRVVIWPDGRAVVTGLANLGNERARSTGRCAVSDRSLDDIGTFGQRLDKPLRRF